MNCKYSHVRRSAALVVHWAGNIVVIYNYATGKSCRGIPLALPILNAADRWIACDDIARALPYASVDDVARTIDLLLDATALLPLDGADLKPELAVEQLSGWQPAAGFFHASTRDVAFVEPGTEPLLSARTEQPPERKRYPDAPSVQLPEYPDTGDLPDVLLRRRTWRRFGGESITLDQAATLLGLTFGIQQWVQADRTRRFPLKTAPSGGALHSLEAYVLAMNVADLESGTYHYDADGHRLTLLRSDSLTPLVPQFLPRQKGFERPCLLVFLTSVFERVYWKYQFPRAYRVVHLEAGHFAQTFCLVATWLGLAPFCTAALADSAIENFLGINGLYESVLYAVGVGTRPQGATWAPIPNSEKMPPVMPSEYESRRNK